MEREACVCDHGYERSDLCAEIIIIIIIIHLMNRVQHSILIPFELKIRREPYVPTTVVGKRWAPALV